jgi:hypothetical protein
MQSLENKLENVYSNVRRVRIAQKRLLHINKIIRELEDRQEELHDLMQEEHMDVVELEKQSISNLFASVLGKRAKSLEIEQQEYLQSLLKYRSVSEELELAQYEKSVLENQVQKLPELEKEMDHLLKLTEQKLRLLNPEIAKKIKDYNLLIDLKKSRIAEIQEAIKVGEEVQAEIEKILKDLHNVRNFGSQGLFFGKGRYASFKKKSYIDNSQKKAVKINALLEKFEFELGDIYKEFDANFHIDEFEHFIDSFYDHLITDWVLQKKLNSAIACTISVSTKVDRLLIMVQAEKEAEESESNRLLLEKKALVLDTSIGNES